MGSINRLPSCNVKYITKYYRAKKRDAKSEQGIFFSYSQNSWAYRIFNNRTRMVMETINVVVNDFGHIYKRIDDDDELAP